VKYFLVKMEGLFMSYARVKPSNQPQSADKISEELSKLVELQTTMKEVNAYWRKFGKPLDGRSVRDHQPRVPVKDTGAR
jgi:hypothetical protein